MDTRVMEVLPDLLRVVTNGFTGLHINQNVLLNETKKINMRVDDTHEEAVTYYKEVQDGLAQLQKQVRKIMQGGLVVVSPDRVMPDYGEGNVNVRAEPPPPISFGQPKPSVERSVERSESTEIPTDIVAETSVDDQDVTNQCGPAGIPVYKVSSPRISRLLASCQRQPPARSTSVAHRDLEKMNPVAYQSICHSLRQTSTMKSDAIRLLLSALLFEAPQAPDFVVDLWVEIVSNFSIQSVLIHRKCLLVEIVSSFPQMPASLRMG
jgi:hypothetical protein